MYNFEPATRLSLKNVVSKKHSNEKLLDCQSKLIKIKRLSTQRIDSIKDILSLPGPGEQRIRQEGCEGRGTEVRGWSRCPPDDRRHPAAAHATRRHLN